MFYKEYSKYYDDIRPMNKKALDFLKKNFKFKKKLLDVACKTGELAINLTIEGHEVQAIDIDKNFNKDVKEGDFIVAGDNFGCGSSREHAPIAIKASGVSCVIAESFARIFYRNSFNIGLPIIESKEASEKIDEDDSIEIDFSNGKIKNITKDEVYKIEAYPEFIQGIIKENGLINYVSKKVGQ